MNESAETLESSRQRMKILITELTHGQGLSPTILEGVKLARADKDLPRHPVLYEPSIYILASGRKVGFVADRTFVYDPNHYLVLTVPLPFDVESELEQDAPLLGISVRLDMAVVVELASKMGLRPSVGEIDHNSSVHPSPLTALMCDAAVRLLRTLRSPSDAAILGPGIVREIVFHALSGPHGHALVAMANKGGGASKIQAALEWIHREYAEPLNAPKMAEAMGMSVSSFHHSFKEITGSSPLQYLKAVRLHKARLHIKYDGLGAAVAAAKVGYESPSQFSRDFKRFFGHPPTRESVRREALIGVDGAEDEFKSSSPRFERSFPGLT
ncbi:AraC-like DNA-binding protein [Silvibacterium bohemicum]|uniref:AraC-like DNA-binding protein n=1 Tax=Silvibacterium bohemicum TaxID=1577686 RepID=A0A841JVC4_9BACT|nr:AraC family transcriptional regulator [Silvibacterium bohemicum]MBB6144417.1 AraC-like DNA-binding protein [Silvibacterium bohemicum]